MDLSPQHLWAVMGLPAKTIFAVLLVMLIWSSYVGIERLVMFIRARAQSRALAEAIAKPLASGDMDASLKLVGADEYKLAYLGAIVKAGLGEYRARPDRHGIESAKRGLERMAMNEAAALRKGMNILATTGSTAPFVGLVGTIFGIINAFSKMSSEGGADLTAISGGIAEALVSTAFGIAVAIVAIWLYNYFNAVIDDISKDMTTSIGELVDWAEKDVLRRSESQAAK
ncbi:MAG: MotA/TolQ/ExbB proton channel family protein [Pseudomonadota bacterium]|nr:MotA/TolQ/ExbB proton channel family protein [Pseudomonadota bacterium]